MEEKILGESIRGKVADILCGILTILVLIWAKFMAETGIDGEWFFVMLLPGVLVDVGIYFVLSRSKMTVTDKRVYGKTIFGKRVDLPLDSISAVGTVQFLQGISVSTASGRITFFNVANQEELHRILSEMLLARQEKQAAQQQSPGSKAEELKKYKELLDCDAISQEEFNKKKAELLG